MNTCMHCGKCLQISRVCFDHLAPLKQQYPSAEQAGLHTKGWKKFPAKSEAAIEYHLSKMKYSVYAKLGLVAGNHFFNIDIDIDVDFDDLRID